MLRSIFNKAVDISTRPAKWLALQFNSFNFHMNLVMAARHNEILLAPDGKTHTLLPYSIADLSTIKPLDSKSDPDCPYHDAMLSVLYDGAKRPYTVAVKNTDVQKLAERFFTGNMDGLYFSKDMPNPPENEYG